MYFSYTSLKTCIFRSTFFMNGERHREDGPAIEYDDGTKELWINGKTIKVAKKSRKPFKSGEKINTVK